MFYLFGSLKNIRVASCTGRLLQQKICIKELCKNSFENIFNQTMRNSRNLQKRIVAASIKTLQIKLLSSRLMFDNSTKLTKFFIFREKQKICLDKKRSMWKVTFYFSKNMSSITFFKKKVPWEKFVKKRRIFCKIFRNVKCFRITMFGWWFAWSGYGTQKCKKNIVHFFKNCYGWITLLTYNYTCRE